MKVLKWLDNHFEEFFLVVFLAVISIVMLAQIIARYIFNNSMPWPEEFCRYCYVWTVFLSLAFTIRKGNMLRVGVVMDLFPAIVQNTVKIFMDFIMLALFVVFFQNSVNVVGYIKNVTGEITSAMRWPMWVVYLCTAFGFGLAALRTIQMIVLDIRHFRVKAETTTEATQKEAQSEAEMARQDDQSYRMNSAQGGKTQ